MKPKEDELFGRGVDILPVLLAISRRSCLWCCNNGVRVERPWKTLGGVALLRPDLFPPPQHNTIQSDRQLLGKDRMYPFISFPPHTYGFTKQM